MCNLYDIYKNTVQINDHAYPLESVPKSYMHICDMFTCTDDVAVGEVPLYFAGFITLTFRFEQLHCLKTHVGESRDCEDGRKMNSRSARNITNCNM